MFMLFFFSFHFFFFLTPPNLPFEYDEKHKSNTLIALKSSQECLSYFGSPLF